MTMRMFLAGVLTLLFSTAAHADAAASAPPDPFETLQAQRLASGIALVKAHQPAEAITAALDPMIRDYEDKYRGYTQQIFCASSQAEAVLYMVEAANAKKQAIALYGSWCQAYFLKAYSLIELHRPEEAKPMLDRAIAMAPRNAHYLSERAQMDVVDRKWPEALARFEVAAEAAKAFGPADANAELGRAWRGIGYVYVEQGRLDEALQIYKRCLDLNPADVGAAREQQYVKGLIAKKGGGS